MSRTSNPIRLGNLYDRGVEKIKKANPDSAVATFIRAAMEALGMNGPAFAERFTTTKASVSGWRAGLYEPAFDKLREISVISGVPLPRGAVDLDDAGRVPVVGEARLGDHGYFDATPYPNGSDGWVKYPGANGTYALRCKGDSMRPRIKPGEFVVIEPNGRIQEGDEVVCQTTDGRRMIKILNRRFADKSVELTSVNDKHEPITLDDDEIEHMHAVAAILKPSMYYPEP